MFKAIRNSLGRTGAVLRLVVLSLVFVFANVFFVRAQAQDREIRVYYPFDNATLSASYLSNAAELSALDSLYRAGAFDGNGSVEVVSYSSPEGQYAYNVALSKRRANAFRNYIVSKYPSLEGRVSVNPCGESWEDLRKAVENDTRLGEKSRKAVLEIIDSNDRPDVKETRLKAIPAYKQLYSNYFRRLRFAFIRLRIENSGETAAQTTDSEISDSLTTPHIPVPGDQIDSSKTVSADTTKVVAADATDGTAAADANTTDTTKTTGTNDNTGKTGISQTDTPAAADSTSVAPVNSGSFVADKDSSLVAPADSTIVPAADSTLVSPADTSAIAPADTTAALPANFKMKEVPQKTMIAAVKTNLLYDALTALNVEVEVPIGRNFSVMVEDVFPWWETGNKYCFQMWEMGLEARYWFKGWDPKGSEKLRGFFAGVYGMSSKYDFQFDRDINLQGEYWSAGVSAGYCMPIGRRKKVNLEFSLAAGPMHTVFRHYQPTQSYDKLIRDPYNAGIDYKTGQWYFGPTKAKISLVVPITVPNGKKEVRHE